MPILRRREPLAETVRLAITNCAKSGNTQDWTLSGGLRITVAKRGEQTIVLRLARKGAIPSVSDVEFFHAALPQLQSAERTPETGYNRTQDADGKTWRWVSFSFDMPHPTEE